VGGRVYGQRVDSLRGAGDQYPAPLSVLRDTVAQFLTLTEADLNGLEHLEP